MKKRQTMLEKVASKAAYESSVKNANSSCYWFFGQPVLPEKVKKLRKF